MARANEDNGVQENVEEPLVIATDGEIVITSWDMWMRLCSDNALKCNVKTLRLRVADEKKGKPLEIKGFNSMRELVIEDDSFRYTRMVLIEDNRLLDSVKIGSRCFNGSIRSSKNSVISIKNCRYLSSFRVEEDSFKHVLKCEFIMTDALQTISWGSGSFDKCKSFYPRNMHPDDNMRAQYDRVIGTVRICQLNGEIGIAIYSRHSFYS